MVCEYKRHGKPFMKIRIMNLFLIMMLKKPVFLCKIKTPYESILIFLSFVNTFSEAAICRCSLKYVLLKFSQYSELKRESSTGVFL